MLNNLSNKHKSIVLFIGMLFAIISTYNLAFEKTLDLKSQCSKITGKLNHLENAPRHINEITAQIENIDHRVGKNKQFVDAEELLLEKAGRLCQQEDVIFKEFPGNHTVTNKEYQLVSYSLILQGEFISLLKILYELEQDFPYGKIAAVHFFTEKDVRTGKKELNMKMIIQSIKLKEDEKQNS